jgi:threonylcarbamoyladenosine tRNA methylthiotransferase MtaB
MRVFFTNLGCKLNQAEMEDLARRMRADGHHIAPSLDEADLHIVNSCTVTHVAARTSRKTARQGQRMSAPPRTVVTGCYASGSAEEAAALVGVDMVVPNSEKDGLLERLYERFPQWRPASKTIRVPVPYVPIEFGNSRGLVKIEDGCDMRCTFCVIPLTRGAQRSRQPDRLIAEVAALVRGGYRELVITGVQISSYRWGRTRLVELVRRLLEETEIERLRLTSIAPWDFQPELLELLDSGRVCRHFHLSLQSGCDRTLKAMRRPYTADQFRGLVSGLHRAVPNLALTTDVIVGFPGESDRDFDDSLEFVESMRFAKVHAFPYSSRPGTAAAERRDPVDEVTRRRRMDRMLAVAEKARTRFQHHQLATTVPVLWERQDGDVWSGTSDNYLRVTTRSTAELGMRITPTRLLSVEDEALRGEPVRSSGQFRSTARTPHREDGVVAACQQ